MFNNWQKFVEKVLEKILDTMEKMAENDLLLQKRVEKLEKKVSSMESTASHFRPLG